MAERLTGQESEYDPDFNPEEFRKTLSQENRFIFWVIGVGLLFVAAFILFDNSPGRVNEKLEKEKASISVDEKQKTMEAQAAETAEKVTAKAEARNTLLYSAGTPAEASVLVSEKTGTEVDDIIFSLRNSSYSILNAVSNGTVKEGDSIEIIQSKVPEAFNTLPNVNIGILYDPEEPANFSMCGTNTTSNTALTNSILYDARVDAFKSGLFDCSTANPYLPTAVTPMKTTGIENLTKTTLLPEVKSALITKNTSSPVDNDGTAVAPSLESQTTKINSEKETNTAGGKTKQVAEPLDIQWGFIIMALLVLIGISILSVVGFKIHSARGKAAEVKRERNENRLKWEEVISRHETILKEWATYELDPVRILELPLLSDMREPHTLDFHKAMRIAKNLKPRDLKSASYSSPFTSDYANAVDSLEDSFQVAEVEAKRVRWSKFTPDERKRLQTAKSLLSLAMDGGATDSERQSAYKRMKKELEGLIVMPKATILVLEKKVNLMLTDGSEDKAFASV